MRLHGRLEVATTGFAATRLCLYSRGRRCCETLVLFSNYTQQDSATVDAIVSFSAYHSLVPITIELPDLASQTRFNLARWTEVLRDPGLAKIPDRIETDRHGHILMTPPPGFRHSERQGQIIALLIQFAPQGQTLPECPISTADGVKVIDV